MRPRASYPRTMKSLDGPVPGRAPGAVGAGHGGAGGRRRSRLRGAVRGGARGGVAGGPGRPPGPGRGSGRDTARPARPARRLRAGRSPGDRGVRRVGGASQAAPRVGGLAAEALRGPALRSGGGRAALPPTGPLRGRRQAPAPARPPRGVGPRRRGPGLGHGLRARQPPRSTCWCSTPTGDSPRAFAAASRRRSSSRSRRRSRSSSRAARGGSTLRADVVLVGRRPRQRPDRVAPRALRPELASCCSSGGPPRRQPYLVVPRRRPRAAPLAWLGRSWLAPWPA